MSDKLLEVENLRTIFPTSHGTIRAVDGIDLYIKRGETVGIVGESGCGKSVTALSILRLVPPPGETKADKLLINNIDLLAFPKRKMYKIRGREIAMISQEPMSSLNPTLTIGEQIAETLHVHNGLRKKEARERAIELLKKAHIPSPHKQVDNYPYQLSGGLRQRATIAMALSCSPGLLIADEPTTALDVTIQAQILDLLCQLQAESGMAVLMITHNLGVIAETAQRVVVMYAGKVVETVAVKELFKNPLHPYTIGLLSSLPRLDKDVKRLKTIPGHVPELASLPKGCRFQNRCSKSLNTCREKEPPLFTIDERKVRCWHYQEGK